MVDRRVFSKLGIVLLIDGLPWTARMRLGTTKLREQMVVIHNADPLFVLSITLVLADENPVRFGFGRTNRPEPDSGSPERIDRNPFDRWTETDLTGRPPNSTTKTRSAF